MEKEEGEDRLILAKCRRREEARGVLDLGVAPLLCVILLLLLLLVVVVLLLLLLLEGREEKEAKRVQEQGVALTPTMRPPAMRLVRARNWRSI